MVLRHTSSHGLPLIARKRVGCIAIARGHGTNKHCLLPPSPPARPHVPFPIPQPPLVRVLQDASRLPTPINPYLSPPILPPPPSRSSPNSRAGLGRGDPSLPRRAEATVRPGGAGCRALAVPAPSTRRLLAAFG